MHPDRYVLEAHPTFGAQFCKREGHGERGQFHLLYPNTGINVFPGPANLSIGPIHPERPEPHRALPRLLLRARTSDEDWLRGVLRLRRPGRARGHARSSSRCSAAWPPGMLDHGRLLLGSGAAAGRVPELGPRAARLEPDAQGLAVELERAAELLDHEARDERAEVLQLVAGDDRRGRRA